MADEVANWESATEAINTEHPFDQNKARQILNLTDEEAAESLEHKIVWKDRRELFKITNENFERPNRMKKTGDFSISMTMYSNNRWNKSTF